MGLDSVELVMAMEEEFGIEIPDRDAEKMYTVGHAYTYIRDRLATTPPVECLSQQVFYKLRRALMDNYGLARQSIAPATRLKDLLQIRQLEEGWPYLQMFIGLKTPHFGQTKNALGHQLTSGKITIGELARALIDLNLEKLNLMRASDQQIWERLVNVVVQQANVKREEVIPEAWFTRDLGID